MGNEMLVALTMFDGAYQPAVKTDILCRDDLSFTKRDAEGRLENWATDGRHQFCGDGWGAGQARCAEVASLATVNEYEAYNALRFAIQSKNWSSQGYGEEEGFASELARLALVGLRALRAGEPRFDPKAASLEAEKALRTNKRKAGSVRSREREVA